MPKAKSITIPISAIAKLSSNISRPTLYKIIRTKKDIVKALLEKEKELTVFYDEIFAQYKKNVYREKRIIREMEKKEIVEIEKNMKENQLAKIAKINSLMKANNQSKEIANKSKIKTIKTPKAKNSQKSKQSI